MRQSFTCGSRDECTNNIGVDKVSQLIALSREAPDLVSQGLIRLLSVVLEVLRVARANVRALEISHKYFF